MTEITNKIFELLKEQPVLSISLGFVLAGFLAWLFRGVIVQIIKKKYGLYDEDEIFNAGISVYGGMLSNDLIEGLKYSRKK